MYYLLYNAEQKLVLEYDELSDYLLNLGYRIAMEIPSSQLDYPTFQLNQQIIRDKELYNSEAEILEPRDCGEKYFDFWA